MADITSNLVGHWKFDEGSGTSIADSSPEGNNGTANGPTWLAGQLGNALSFDGTNDYVNVPWDASLSVTGAVTIAKWVYPTSFGANSYPLIAYNSSDGRASYSVFIAITSSFGISYHNDAGTLVEYRAADNALVANVWQHIAITRASDGTITMYVNGAVVSNSQVTGSGSVAPTTSANRFDIGYVVPFGALPYVGRMDDVRVYSRALTANDIAALYGHDGSDASDAYPDVHTVAQGRTSAADTTSHPITMPADVAVGDIIMVEFSVDGNPTISINTGVSGSNWNRIGQASNGTTVTGDVFWKIAEGGDALTLTTSASEQSSHISHCIKNHGGAVEGASANGSSTNSNPPSLTPSWGSADNLWIATRHGDSTVLATVPPSNFAPLYSQAAVGTASASTSSAHRKHTNSVLDPGTFTSATEQWVSFTIAIKPASSTSDAVGSSSAAATSAATGAANKASTASVSAAAVSAATSAAQKDTSSAISAQAVSAGIGASIAAAVGTIAASSASAATAAAIVSSAGANSAALTSAAASAATKEAVGTTQASTASASTAEAFAAAVGISQAQALVEGTAEATKATVGAVSAVLLSEAATDAVGTTEADGTTSAAATAQAVATVIAASVGSVVASASTQAGALAIQDTAGQSSAQVTSLAASAATKATAGSVLGVAGSPSVSAVIAAVAGTITASALSQAASDDAAQGAGSVVATSISQAISNRVVNSVGSVLAQSQAQGTGGARHDVAGSVLADAQAYAEAVANQIIASMGSIEAECTSLAYSLPPGRPLKIASRLAVLSQVTTGVRAISGIRTRIN